MAAKKKRFEPMDETAFEKYMEEKLCEVKNRLRSEPWKSKDTSQPCFKGTHYAFDNPHRGVAVIFQNEKFIPTEETSLENRDASPADALDLVHSFKKLGFDVLQFDDLTASQIQMAAFYVARKYRHEESDCFVCVLLSHGTEDSSYDKNGEVLHHTLFGSDSEPLFVQSIINAFNDKNCGPLKNKPRLFFLQACRGDKADDGVNITGNPSAEPSIAEPSLLERITIKVKSHIFTETKKKIIIHPTPLYQDCLIMYATPPGYNAVKRQDFSWFIHELCEFLQREEVETVSFVRGLTSVSDKVARKYESETGKKEMTIIDTMLIKDIIMGKKN